MRFLSALLLLSLQGQDQHPPLPKEPIQDWKYKLTDVRRDPSTKLDVEEVTLLLEGKEAIPRSLVKDKEIFDLRGIDARYFTTPKGKDDKSREIKVKADRGRLDKGARTLKLDDNVSVVRVGLKDKEMPERDEPDTVLRTPSALLRFNRAYECPACRKVFGAPGHCPNDGAPLDETTVTSVETDREFELLGPEGILSGYGLVTDDAIRRDYHIARNGFVEFSGDLSAAGKGGPPTPKTVFTQVYSRGPLAITGPFDARRLHGEGGVRVDRIDDEETLTLQAETLTLDTVRRWDWSPTGPIDLRTIDGKGDVVLDGISFEDGESFHATADTLLRTLSDDDKEDVTVMTARTPRVVSLTRGPSRIDSRKVTIHKAPEGGHGTSVFEDVVRSDLVSGGQHFNLACGRLVTFAGPGAEGKTELQSIEATEHVVLGGLMAKAAAPPSPKATEDKPSSGKATEVRPSPGSPADPGDAKADHFHWDMAVRRGWLEGTPFVRITQGSSVIIAPKVLLESEDIIVLKGPKNVRLIQEHDGKKEEYRATCDGDMVIDNSAANHRLLMRDRCVLRTEDMLLNSDRINAVLSPDGKGIESLLALGRVNALRGTDHTTLYGDRLFYRFADQNLQVYGSPRTVADAGHTSSTQEQIRVYDKPDPRTGEMVRYTEMVGGSDGVHIEVQERAAPKVDERKK
jgi:hypothetical protein